VRGHATTLPHSLHSFRRSRQPQRWAERARAGEGEREDEETAGGHGAGRAGGAVHVRGAHAGRRRGGHGAGLVHPAPRRARLRGHQQEPHLQREFYSLSAL
jgi:hypothetical protein